MNPQDSAGAARRVRTLRYTVETDHSGLRVDAFLSKVVEGYSRSQISRWSVAIRVNGEQVRSSRTVNAGDSVEVDLVEPEAHDLTPEKVPFTVIYEDDRVIVVDKPAGIVVHPAAGNWRGTLVHGLLHHESGLVDRFGDNSRPGIVHRLDKETSGLLVVAKDPDAHEILSSQFANRTVEKRYIAIVRGTPPRHEGRIGGYLIRDFRNRKRFAYSNTRGKAAATSYRVLLRLSAATLICLSPHTGRTHQLRVHMSHIQTPIVGDSIYSRARTDDGLMLHAATMKILLPRRGTPSEFQSPLPQRFRDRLLQEGAEAVDAERDWYEALPEW